MSMEATAHTGFWPRSWAHQLALAAGTVSVAAVWIFTHPYVGVSRDAIVYVGRAMADLYPAGVGRELDYVHDGQSGFSLYPRLLHWAAAALGPGAAAEALSAAGLACWIAAATFLLARFANGVRLWAAMICLAAMPPDYGFLNVYHYAEVLALPRAMAEAAGLAALGFFYRDRLFAALACAVVAASLHPLMALPVLGVLLILLCLRDRRWLILAAAGLAAVLVAAAAGAPLAARLFERFDPTWRAVIALRTPPVFIPQWTQASWGLLTCQLATVLLAGTTVERPPRALFLSIAAVAVAGVAVSLAPSVLLAQLQPWRAQWLLAAAAAASTPFLAEALWRRGAASRAAIAALALAWLARDSIAAALVAGLAALALAAWPRGRAFPRPLELGLWAILTGVAIATEGARAAVCLTNFAGAARFPMASLNATGLIGLPAAALAAILAVSRRELAGARSAALALAAATIALIAAAGVWDDRPPFTRWSESVSRAPPLKAMLAPGFVYWLGDYGVNWLVTGAPEWWSTFQGAGVVFDRGQAMDWSRRRGVARDAGLMSKPGRLADVTTAGLTRLCRASDGPQWVVTPVASVRDPALLTKARPSRAGAPETLRAATGTAVVVVRDYAIFGCEAFKSLDQTRLVSSHPPPGAS